MSHRLMLGAFLSQLWLFGCGDECPGSELRVVTFSGDPVNETAIACDGSAVTGLGACEAPEQSFVSLASPDDDCDGVRIILGNAPLSGDLMVLWLFGEDEVTSARIEVTYICEGGDCPPFEAPELLEGIVSPDVFSHAGRNTGRIDFEFAGGSMWGTYDVSPL